MSQFPTSPHGPVAHGAIDATGLPALVLCASMIGYGSMAREAGLTLWTSVASTGLIWGLPGQIAMVELYALGAPAIALIVAASAANARFLPMVLSVMPVFNEAPMRRGWHYVIAQFMSLTTWAVIMRDGRRMNPEYRTPYYAGFAGVCFGAALTGTVAGFLLAGVLPRDITLSLVLLNPIFFTLIFVDTRVRGEIIAVLAGIAAGPLFHLLSADWGLVLTGAVAGTGAYLLDRVMGRRNA